MQGNHWVGIQNVPVYNSVLTMTSTGLILAICRTPVTNKFSKMTLLSMISRSSVDRAPAREVMGSIPVGDSEFSLFHARVMLISSLFSCLVVGSQVHAAVKGRAFQKLLEISQNAAKKKVKSCFLHESCSIVA